MHVVVLHPKPNNDPYIDFTVYFENHSPVLVHCRSFTRAAEVAMNYINGSLARLYTGQPPVTPNDLLKVVYK
jgi:protein tyrosine phosphatase (PTP) superfamily phosphohydrolase (DUF442 family)